MRVNNFKTDVDGFMEQPQIALSTRVTLLNFLMTVNMQ